MHNIFSDMRIHDKLKEKMCIPNLVENVKVLKPRQILQKKTVKNFIRYL